MANKRDIAKRISSKTLHSQKDTLEIVERTFDEIVELLLSGEDISIVGFGKFYLYEHSARPVRNPKTQEEMILKPYKALRFKPSNVIKKTLKEELGE
jgi:nucleoid DNA-binding protein